ncbi:MAG: hypothetical protein ABR498_08085 [Candidatus Dormibacteria bacterium]
MAGVIQETCLEIGELEERWVRLREAQTARRKRLYVIDELIEEFEKLNLADESEVPIELRGRVLELIRSEPHPLSTRPSDDVRIPEWMDVLYDLQDDLMFGTDED